MKKLVTTFVMAAMFVALGVMAVSATEYDKGISFEDYSDAVITIYLSDLLGEDEKLGEFSTVSGTSSLFHSNPFGVGTATGTLRWTVQRDHNLQIVGVSNTSTFGWTTDGRYGGHANPRVVSTISGGVATLTVHFDLLVTQSGLWAARTITVRLVGPRL